MIQTCSLCNWFSVNTDDILCDAIKARHEEFHGKARIQHRNTTQGVVEWL